MLCTVHGALRRALRCALRSHSRHLAQVMGGSSDHTRQAQPRRQGLHGQHERQEQQGQPRQQPRQQGRQGQPGWRPWWSSCSTHCCGCGWGCQKTSQQEQIDHCTQAASWPTCASVASYLGAAETGRISAGAGADSGDCKPGLTSAQAPGAKTQGHCCGPAVCRVTAGSYCSQAQGSSRRSTRYRPGRALEELEERIEAK